MSSPPRLSVAIPVYDEEAVLPELLARLGNVLDAIPGGPHQILFVDDGSRDGSLALLRAAAQRDGRIAVVALSRNFGHQAAISAALDHAEGDAVVIMDADLQDAPEEIPRLLAAHAEGYDVVYARRVRRKEGLLLRFAYAAFYRLAAALAETPLPLDSGDFALLSRPVVDALRQARERHRYLRGLRSWVGFRQVGIEVERARRAGGEPKYGLARLTRLALDGLFAFSVLPLRAAALLGLTALVASGGYTLYALWAKLALHRSPQGFTALILVITFLAGIQLLFLGVIGEYVGRVYEEVKARPIYLVREIVRGAPPGETPVASAR